MINLQELKEIKKFTDLPIGAIITLSNKYGYYILYGYNLDKSLIACFPYKYNDSSNTYINENLIYIPVLDIVSAYTQNQCLHTSFNNLTLQNE